MGIESAIFSILTNDSAVAALVSTRVFPNNLDQGEPLPAIVYQEISGVDDNDSGGSTNLVDARFQVDCYAATYLETMTLAAAVRAALNGYAGTSDGTVIHSIFKIDGGDIPNLSPGNEALKRYGKRLDFRIHYKPT